MLDAAGEEDNVVDHPVYFCPFCGKGLQTEAEVATKVGPETA
jgi:hypothetical protein